MQQEPKVEEERPDLEHGKMPDPEAKAISCLFDQIRALEKKVDDLTGRLEQAESKPATKAAVKRNTTKTSVKKTVGKASASSAKKLEKSEA